jgi:hypothetical protein
MVMDREDLRQMGAHYSGTSGKVQWKIYKNMMAEAVSEYDLSCTGGRGGDKKRLYFWR